MTLTVCGGNKEEEEEVGKSEVLMGRGSREVVDVLNSCIGVRKPCGVGTLGSSSIVGGSRGVLEMLNRWKSEV